MDQYSPGSVSEMIYYNERLRETTTETNAILIPLPELLRFCLIHIGYFNIVGVYIKTETLTKHVI